MNENRKLLKEAFLEANKREFDNVPDENDIKLEFTDGFDDRLRAAVFKSKSQRSYRTVLKFSVAAAALLIIFLCGRVVVNRSTSRDNSMLTYKENNHTKEPETEKKHNKITVTDKPGIKDNNEEQFANRNDLELYSSSIRNAEKNIENSYDSNNTMFAENKPLVTKNPLSTKKPALDVKPDYTSLPTGSNNPAPTKKPVTTSVPQKTQVPSKTEPPVQNTLSPAWSQPPAFTKQPPVSTLKPTEPNSEDVYVVAWMPEKEDFNYAAAPPGGESGPAPSVIPDGEGKPAGTSSPTPGISEPPAMSTEADYIESFYRGYLNIPKYSFYSYSRKDIGYGVCLVRDSYTYAYTGDIYGLDNRNYIYSEQQKTAFIMWKQDGYFFTLAFHNNRLPENTKELMKRMMYSVSKK